MIIIVTDSYEHCIPDAQVHNWFEEVKAEPVVFISNEIQWHRLRLAHVEEVIHIDHIEFNGEEHFVNEDAIFTEAKPKNFFWEATDIIVDTLKAQGRRQLKSEEEVQKFDIIKECHH